MRIAVYVDDGVIEAAIETAARAGISAEKIVEEALKMFVRANSEVKKLLDMKEGRES